MFVGLVLTATGLCLLFASLAQAFLNGFSVAALFFIASTLRLWVADSEDDLRRRALRDDGGRLLILLAALLIIAAVMIALGHVIGGRTSLDLAEFSGVAATLLLSWLVVNLLFAFHYAHIYYVMTDGHDAGGIVFPETASPLFADFVYFSFVIGMTCQTADVNITSRPVRRLATCHGLFAFFFNLGVLALTVNILASLL
jgi:uncharacterized membrane protein